MRTPMYLRSLGAAIAVLFVTASLGGCSILDKIIPGGTDSAKSKAPSKGNFPSSGGNSSSPAPSSAAARGPSTVAPEAMAPPINIPELPAELVVAPSGGAWTYQPQVPTWCDREFKAYRESDGENERSLKTALGDLSKVARFACTWPNNENQQKWTAAALQSLVNTMGISQAQIHNYMRAKLNWGDFVETETCPFEVSQMDLPSEKARNLVKAAVYCNKRIGDFKTALWNSDRTPTLNPSVAVGLMYLGLKINGASAKESIKKGEVPVSWITGHQEAVAHYAFFRKDIEDLNEESVFSDAAQYDLKDIHMGLAIEKFFQVKKYIALLQTTFAEMAQGQPGLEDVFNTAPLAAHQSWVEEYTANKDVLDQALAMEVLAERGDAAALANCQTEQSQAWQNYAATHDPKSKEDILEIAATPVGYVLLTGLFHCETFHGQGQAGEIAGLLGKAALQRGPRTAAQQASVRAIGIARKTNRRFPLTPKLIFGASRQAQAVYDMGVAYSGDGGWWEGHGGTVKRVTDDGDYKVVEFKRETIRVPKFRCTETNRIDGINPDGTIRYRLNCVQNGMETIDVTAPTAHIRAVRAAGIRPGAYVYATTSDSRMDETAPNYAHSMQVFQNPSQDRLLAAFGVPIAR